MGERNNAWELFEASEEERRGFSKSRRAAKAKNVVLTRNPLLGSTYTISPSFPLNISLHRAGPQECVECDTCLSGTCAVVRGLPLKDNERASKPRAVRSCAYFFWLSVLAHLTLTRIGSDVIDLIHAMSAQVALHNMRHTRMIGEEFMKRKRRGPKYRAGTDERTCYQLPRL